MAYTNPNFRGRAIYSYVSIVKTCNPSWLKLWTSIATCLQRFVCLEALTRQLSPFDNLKLQSSFYPSLFQEKPVSYDILRWEFQWDHLSAVQKWPFLPRKKFNTNRQIVSTVSSSSLSWKSCVCYRVTESIGSVTNKYDWVSKRKFRFALLRVEFFHWVSSHF